MNEMVERVARAIQQVSEQDGAAPYDGLDAILGAKAAQQERDRLFAQAHAAIAAMRDPTPAMTAVHKPMGGNQLCDGARDEQAAEVWQAMIDAALKEQS